ncbi:unnamed protein product [Malus baccata var. baccata]
MPVRKLEGPLLSLKGVSLIFEHSILPLQFDDANMFKLLKIMFLDRARTNFSRALKMKAKFVKYSSKCNLALAVAAILDPQFKLKLVEYYYSQIYGSTALDRIKEVSDGLKELFDAYSICSTMVDQGPALPGSSLPSTSTDSRDRLKGFDKFLYETSQIQNMISDLDKYLELPVFPRSCDFKKLNWWKVYTPRYPILSMMARDVLGTPMSMLRQNRHSTLVVECLMNVEAH